MLPTMLPTAGQPLLGSAPVLAVKIDNTSSARPRVGLDSADIVYVEPVEAGLTRLMAIYASAKPAEVGPIRSARESDVAVLANYGRVAFAYSGASTITAATLAGGRQVNVSMDSGGGASGATVRAGPPTTSSVAPRRCCLEQEAAHRLRTSASMSVPSPPRRDPEAA